MKTNIFYKVNGKALNIAIVKARFNQEITNGLLDGALESLREAGVKKQNIKIFEAPGSFEIPLFCQKIAKTKKFHGIITLGAVIKGETAHFEYISQAVTSGILRVMLDYGLPISFGVITTYNKKQAQVRAKDNKENKGREATMSLLETIVGLKK